MIVAGAPAVVKTALPDGTGRHCAASRHLCRDRGHLLQIDACQCAGRCACLRSHGPCQHLLLKITQLLKTGPENPPAPVVITTRAERMFRTRLTDASKESPNFAGHYRFATWGCGSECISGAIIDLETGKVFSPPLASEKSDPGHFNVCQSAYENSGVDFRVTSRLLVLRCGLNHSERLHTNVPDAYYFVWHGDRFEQILRVPADRIG
jgi:hypothetical protein